MSVSLAKFQTKCVHPPWYPPTFITVIKLLFIMKIEMDINKPL